jgi:regulator of sigma E protease
VLVTVHEFGHFIVAKKFGIKVDEFGFGFPPRAAVLGKIGETLYTVNWIPFGGFVKIFGENPDAESMTGPDSSRSMVNKPKLVQAAVLFAGIFFNIVFAWILISVGYMTGLPTSVSEAPKKRNHYKSSIDDYGNIAKFTSISRRTPITRYYYEYFS